MTRLNITTTPVSHVELQPICDFGEHRAPVFIEEADFFNVYWATSGVPAMWDRTFDELDEALDYIFNDPKFVGVRRWYNGNENMEEIASREDVFFALCDAEFYDDDTLIDIGEKMGFTAQEVEDLVASHASRHVPERPKIG